jgi:Predicted transcription factor, homolog of eukaryotic MBF1
VGTDFSAWLTSHALAAGYDPMPRRGGRTRLAEATGINATNLGRILDGKTKPDIETQRKLARTLGVTLIEMMLRSGDLTPDDLPHPGVSVPATDDIDLWTLGERLHVPEEQRSVFVGIVGSVAKQLSGDQNRTTVVRHAAQTGGKTSAEG